MEDANPELETFRQKWREEVSAKVQDSRSTAGPSKGPRRLPYITQLPESNTPKSLEESDDHGEPPSIFGLDAAGTDDDNEVNGFNVSNNEPQSALEHYEKAVERENQGSLGDSLNLYRKAYRVSSETLLKAHV